MDGIRAIDVSVGAAPLEEEEVELPEDDPLELLEVDEAPDEEELLDELEPPEELDPVETPGELLDDPPPHPTSAPLSRAINTTLRASRIAPILFIACCYQRAVYRVG